MGERVKGHSEWHQQRPLHRARGGAVVAGLCLWVGFGCFAALCGAPPVHAQLRPIESIDWLAFDDNIGSAYVGAAGFRGHPVSLLGSAGRLIELGLVGANIRSGRVVLSVHGSAYRIFDASESFAEPSSVVEGDLGVRRTDHGDYRLATSVRLTDGIGTWDAAFRFGVRLPTTDDRVGLERDQTDFFLTVAGRYARGRVALEFEGGGGIYGVAGPRFDQTDPLLYATGVSYRGQTLETAVRLAGHYDTRVNGPPRGNEHLSELQLGVRTLGATWVHADVIRGIAEFSPNWGLQVRLGRSF